jgi:shikimate dehydrogenase
MPSTDTISRETTLCVSLAARLSIIGTRFHNFLYDELGLDYVYKAFAPTDIGAAVAGIRGLGIRGAGVSMPYKEACIPLLDELDDSAAVLESVNTIVNTGGRLRGYNTDYIAVRQVLIDHGVAPDLEFAVLGNGGMARAVVAALRDAGFCRGTVVAPRSPDRGAALADRYGFAAAAGTVPRPAPLLINVTPIGMAGTAHEHDLPFDRALVAQAEVVFDVVAFPSRTLLVQLAEELGRTTISGAEVIALQAAEQFALYTGIRPTGDQGAPGRSVLPRLARRREAEADAWPGRGYRGSSRLDTRPRSATWYPLRRSHARISARSWRLRPIARREPGPLRV